MSIFDSDLVTKIPDISKDESIKYTLDWIIQKERNYLVDYVKSKNKDSQTILFCQEYLRSRFDHFFEQIWFGLMPESHPEECKVYPAIHSYDVKVEYMKKHQIYTFSVYCQYRMKPNLTYKRYVAEFEL